MADGILQASPIPKHPPFVHSQRRADMTKKQVETRAQEDFQFIIANGSTNQFESVAYFAGFIAYTIKMNAAKKKSEKEFWRVRGEMNTWCDAFIEKKRPARKESA